MMEAIASIAARAKAAGKHAAMYVVDPAQTGRFVAMGFRLIAIGTDARYMMLGAASLLDTARASVG